MIKFWKKNFCQSVSETPARRRRGKRQKNNETAAKLFNLKANAKSFYQVALILFTKSIKNYETRTDQS